MPYATHLTTSVQPHSARAVILPPEMEATLKTAHKGQRRAIAQRLGDFGDWLDATGRNWTAPDLVIYRDTLLAAGKAPSTVNAHLSTIRSRYETLLTDNTRLADLRQQAAAYLEAHSLPRDPANIKASTDMLIESMRNTLNPKQTSAKEITVQDRAAGDFIRLTQGQANRLIAAPGTGSLTGLRDTALMTLALCTGARAAELAALEVGDHKARTESGALALLIRDGKGGKQRLVPYGGLDFAVAIVETWLKHAGITSGPIFRGFFRGGHTVRKTALTTVAIEQIVAAYPVVIDGQSRTVKPHDLRRTYARLAYEAGMLPVAIQQNLGHASLDTTLIYIGELNDTARQPGAFLSFDLAALS